MIKFKQGWIGGNDGIKKDIIVQAAAPNTLRDALIGGSLVLMGITYLTVTAFKNGASKFEDAEFKVLSDLNLVSDADDMVEYFKKR